MWYKGVRSQYKQKDNSMESEKEPTSEPDVQVEPETKPEDIEIPDGGTPGA
jgi:hypothetical protein